MSRWKCGACSFCLLTWKPPPPRYVCQNCSLIEDMSISVQCIDRVHKPCRSWIDLKLSGGFDQLTYRVRHYSTLGSEQFHEASWGISTTQEWAWLWLVIFELKSNWKLASIWWAQALIFYYSGLKLNHVSQKPCKTQASERSFLLSKLHAIPSSNSIITDRRRAFSKV